MDGETYIGDGVRASFDGWVFRLRVPREGGDHVVYLDVYTINALNDYVTRIREQASPWKMGTENAAS